MNDAREPGHEVLKGVSRSFYLSLRLLPAPMRKPAGLAYLLARASDTIADSSSIPAGERIGFLDLHARQVAGLAEAAPWPDRLIASAPDPHERRLLENQTCVLGALSCLDSASLALVREVISVIIGGQRLDLERFGDATGRNIVALPDAAALEDYTWRVAGCVGVFWTDLGYATLGGGFSDSPPHRMRELATTYGSGLQLVNILRDLGADLRSGRCYLPVSAPGDGQAMKREFSEWREIARSRVSVGLEYSDKLRSRRLRAASALPALIGMETLDLLKGLVPAVTMERVRIPRRRVYSLMLRAFLRG